MSQYAHPHCGTYNASTPVISSFLAKANKLTTTHTNAIIFIGFSVWDSLATISLHTSILSVVIWDTGTPQLCANCCICSVGASISISNASLLLTSAFSIEDADACDMDIQRSFESVVITSTAVPGISNVAFRGLLIVVLLFASDPLSVAIFVAAICSSMDMVCWVCIFVSSLFFWVRISFVSCFHFEMPLRRVLTTAYASTIANKIRMRMSGQMTLSKTPRIVPASSMGSNINKVEKSVNGRCLRVGCDFRRFISKLTTDPPKMVA
mmetsp:Transcript_22566/g.36204  ORF Transcript_22566/g.36204 Transcript_22566/m.36204 type:complete len:266 (+) Transcript_22566:579-1376(+)